MSTVPLTPDTTAVVRTSIGRKLLVALTGLFLIVFLLEHLLGNLKLIPWSFFPFGGPDARTAYNEYSHFMTTNPLIRVVEIVLFSAFLLHIPMTLFLNWRNRKARPVRYQVTRPGANSSLASRSMVLSGIILLLFTVIHLGSFFWPYRITGDVDDLYNQVVHKFSQPLFVVFYLVSFALLFFHLSHGIYSGFQTLGLILNKKLERIFKGIAAAVAIVLFIGNAFIPVYILISVS